MVLAAAVFLVNRRWPMAGRTRGTETDATETDATAAGTKDAEDTGKAGKSAEDTGKAGKDAEGDPEGAGATASAAPTDKP